jgi:dimethylamine/trimethylamine dehydrogenase
MAGQRPEGPLVIYDDDHYYMGNVIAELLRAEGHVVTLATPALCVARWTEHTLEQAKIERRLVELGVDILTRHQLVAVEDGAVELVETLKGATVTLNGALVSVTARLPHDELYYALVANSDRLAAAGIQSVRRIGDCFGPATIAAAVYEGHRYARELDTEADPDAVPFKRERFDLDSV